MQRKAIPSLSFPPLLKIIFSSSPVQMGISNFLLSKCKESIVIVLGGLQLVKRPGTLSPSGPLQIAQPPCDNALRQRALLCCPGLSVGRRRYVSSKAFAQIPVTTITDNLD